MVIELDVVDRIGVVRLAHGKVNALDLELCRAIARTMRDLDGGDVRGLVLTGSGKAFSAGVDLKRVVAGGAAYVAEFVPALVAAFRAVFDVGKPVVAAIGGHAIAGGFVLAAACDHRITSGGTIGLPELRVGVPFPDAALEVVRYALGPVAARRVVLDAANRGPADALALGLVDELCEPDALRARAIAAAAELCDRVPADTFRHTKAQLHREIDERLDRATDVAVVELWTKAATDGRIQAFLDRTVGRSAPSA